MSVHSLNSRIRGLKVALQRQPTITFALVCGVSYLVGYFLTGALKEQIDRLPILNAASILTAPGKQVVAVDNTAIKRIAAVAGKIEGTQQIAENPVSESSLRFGMGAAVAQPSAPLLNIPVPEISASVQHVSLSMLISVIEIQGYSPAGVTLNGEFIGIGEPIKHLPMLTDSGKERHAVVSSVSERGAVIADPLTNQKYSIGF